MPNKDKNIPKRRFKEFENADAWELHPLREIGNTYTGLSGKTKDDFGHGDGRFVTYMNVFSNPISLPEMVEEVEFDESQNTVRYGDVLFTTSSETPEEVGMSSVWLENTENTYLNSFCFGFRPVKKVNPYYLAYLLRSSGMRRKISFLAQGISRYNISKTKMMELEISIPNVNEQSAIGTFFSTLDRHITLHQRKLDKLKSVKQAYLSEMFPAEGERVPKRRFPGFTDAWELRKLGEVADIIGGGTPSTSNSEFWDGDIDWYTPAEIGEQIYVDGSERKITQLGLDKSSATLLPANKTILFTSRAGIGKTAILRSDATTNQGFQSIVVDNNTEPYFIFSMTDKIKNKAISVASGSTFAEISSRALGQLEFMFPSINEQKAIGTFFSTLDQHITLHQRKLDKLKSVKQAYLSEMFPAEGERVPKRRFPGFTDDWEQRKLGEISEKVTLKNKDNTFDETLTNSAEFGIISQNDFFDKEISNRSNLNGYYVVENNNFVYNPRISNFAPVGPIKRNKLGRTGVMSPLYYVFKTRNIDNDFLEKYFDTTYWHIFMKLNGDSGARADRFAIKDSVFKEMPIPFPKIEEQIKIGNFFKQLDDTIALHQRKSI